MERHNHPDDQRAGGQNKLHSRGDLTAQLNTGFVEAELCLNGGESTGKSDTIRDLNASLPITRFACEIARHEPQAEVEPALVGEPREVTGLLQLSSLVYPWGGGPVPILVDAPAGPSARERFLASDK